jgi:hypothetical protein
MRRAYCLCDQGHFARLYVGELSRFRLWSAVSNSSLAKGALGYGRPTADPPGKPRQLAGNIERFSSRLIFP